MLHRAFGEPWFPGLQGAPPSAIFLFCFPYAGGNAGTYRQWTPAAMPGVHAAAAHLPGRAGRIREAAYRRIGPLAEALAEALAPFTERPYALFGHSMGALVAFEVARALRRRGGRLPERLLVSGRRAPHLPNQKSAIHDLPRAEFLRELRDLEGTPDQFFTDPELLDLMLPALRADFELCHSYRFQEEEPLDCAISAFGGEQDSGISRGDLEAWRRHTRTDFRLQMLPGGHFFVDRMGAEFGRLVAQELHPERLDFAELAGGRQ
ncbi:MAG TPA: alpha/beta fold hydrolase [Bryobacteraceae bacterium]|nr:alpha/beta fold hydrolase [Bryobacteraceae bacterium]